MAHIKNQQMFHLIGKNAKNTACGLSNQWNDAKTLENFNKYLNDSYYKDCCCKKCQQSIK